MMSTKKSKKQKKKNSKKEKKSEEDKNYKKSKDSPKRSETDVVERHSESKSSKRKRSRSRSPDKKRRAKEKDHGRLRRKNEKSRSRSRSRSGRHEKHRDHRKFDNSSPKNAIDESMKIDKKKLLEIAKANIVKSSLHFKYTNININSEAAFKPGPNKSIDELVEYCKKLSNELNNSDTENEKIYHPFEKKDAEDYVIPRTHQTPFQKDTNIEIKSAFPVSSGCEHRIKTNESENSSGNELVAANTDMDNQISELIKQKIKVSEKLNQNQIDFEAQRLLEEINLKIQNWLNSKTNTANAAKFLTPQELEGQYIAWTRKDIMSKAIPITEGIGKRLLEKMGWKEGEGLGKKKEGTLNPLALGIKTDRKGLVSIEEVVKSKSFELSLFPDSKHPINILLEYCKFRKWEIPIFELVSETGPPHLRIFKMKVILNSIEYQPENGSHTKKAAKTNAAVTCLQQLGVLNK